MLALTSRRVDVYESRGAYHRAIADWQKAINRGYHATEKLRHWIEEARSKL